MSHKLTLNDLPRSKAMIDRHNAAADAAASMLIPDQASTEQCVAAVKIIGTQLDEFRALAVQLEAELLEAKGLIKLNPCHAEDC